MNTYLHNKDSTMFRDFYHKIYVPKRMLKEQCVELIKKEMFYFLKCLPVKKDYFDCLDFENLEVGKFKTQGGGTIVDEFDSPFKSISRDLKKPFP